MPTRTVPTRTVRAVALALSVALALLAAACGGGGEAGLTDREERFAAAFARDLAEGGEGPVVTADEARCVGEAIMDVLGAEPFVDAGLEPADLAGDETPGQLLGEGRVSDAQAEEVADRWLDCVDLADTFVEQARGRIDLTERQQECFREGLDEAGALEDYLEVSFTSDDPADVRAVTGAMALILQSCTPAAEPPTEEQIVANMSAAFAGNGLATEDQARCLAEGIVGRVGVEALGGMVADGGLSGPAAEDQLRVSAAMREAAGECGVVLPESAYEVAGSTTTAAG